MKRSEFTVEKLIEMNVSLDTAEALRIEFYKEIEQKRVKPPSRLVGAGLSNPERLRQYAQELEDYEKKKEEIAANKKEHNKERGRLDNVVTEYAKHLADLDDIPAKYREKVWDLAWRYGHANGYREVLNYVDDLKELF